MTETNKPAKNSNGNEMKKVLTSFFAGLARELVKLVAAFAVGTGGAAIVCWYYGVPLGFSILGGILVLGLAVALTSDSWLA